MVNPEMVAELLRQLAFLSAVLGGFAATFLGTLLSINERRAIINWAVGAASIAAVGFILAAILAAFGSASFNVDVPQQVLVRRRMITVVLFHVGLFPLLIAIGLCGWSRSRAVGIISSVAALIGMLFIVIMLVEG